MSEDEYDDIDEDGTVGDPWMGIETYFCPLESVGETETFLRVTGDNGRDER